jgi:Tfp pilus assembly protein PilF
MNFFSRLLFILVFSSCLTAFAQPSAQLEKLFASGVQALKTGQLDEAEKTFLQVLRQGGKASFVHHNLGIVYQQRGAHDKAVWQFREALRLQPDYGEARLLIGYSLLALGKNAEAVRELERAVKLLPQQPQARLQLAKAYERSHNWFGVVEQYRVLRELEPGNGEYAYQLGKAYQKLSDWSYQQIIRVNPGAARLYQTLGQNYLQQGKYELAILEYERALQADPKLPELHLALALIYLEQKRFDEAAKEIELELKLAPDSKKALEAKQQIQAAKP